MTSLEAEEEKAKKAAEDQAYLFPTTWYASQTSVADTHKATKHNRSDIKANTDVKQINTTSANVGKRNKNPSELAFDIRNKYTGDYIFKTTTKGSVNILFSRPKATNKNMPMREMTLPTVGTFKGHHGRQGVKYPTYNKSQKNKIRENTLRAKKTEFSTSNINMFDTRKSTRKSRAEATVVNTNVNSISFNNRNVYVPKSSTYTSIPKAIPTRHSNYVNA